MARNQQPHFGHLSFGVIYLPKGKHIGVFFSLISSGVTKRVQHSFNGQYELCRAMIHRDDFMTWCH
jgi:hypothetical protein